MLPSNRSASRSLFHSTESGRSLLPAIHKAREWLCSSGTRTDQSLLNPARIVLSIHRGYPPCAQVGVHGLTQKKGMCGRCDGVCQREDEVLVHLPTQLPAKPLSTGP